MSKSSEAMLKKRLSANARLEKLQQIYPILNATSAPNLAKKESAKSQPSALPANSTEFNRCICNRKPQTLVCINCKMFTYGRIAQMCLDHVNVSFLMDFSYCPNCLGPKQLMRGVDVDQGVYRQVNSNESRGGASNNIELEGAAAIHYGVNMQNT